MSIIVPSPLSGRPVKVREEDVGRAVRDEDGRIFYVLPKRESEGYYAARTRAGSEKDELHSAELEKVMSEESEADHDRAPAHDATGEKRQSRRGKTVILVMVVILAILVYLFGWTSLGQWRDRTGPAQNDPTPGTNGKIPEAPEAPDRAVP